MSEMRIQYVGKNRYIRKKILFLLSILIGSSLLWACVDKRQIQNNNFTSAYPAISVMVDKEFYYLGNGSYNSLSKSSNNPNGPKGRYAVDFYFFAPEKIENNTVHKGVVVYFSNMQSPGWWWSLPFFKDDSKFVFDHGMKLLGGEYYEYAVEFEQTKNDDKIGAWLNQKGYKIPSCRIKKSFKKLEKDDLSKTVMYYEDLSPSGLECSNWKDRANLTDKQKEFVSKFVSQADKALQIVPYKN